MLLVGLTGGFGSGKTTVASMMQALGAKVVDADVLAREVLSPGSEAFNQVVEAFGTQVVSPSGRLDRNKLAKIVFADPAAISKLNSIVHPRVIEREEEIIDQIATSEPDAIIVLDVPLLIEAERHHRVDVLVVVDAPMQVRLTRLAERYKGLDKAALQARMQHQMPLEHKVKLADFVIDNSKSLKSTREQTERLFAKLVQLAAERKRSRPTNG